MNESLNNSLNKSLRNWSRDSELLKDIMELAKKYGVEYELNDYFENKGYLLTFSESYDLWELYVIFAANYNYYFSQYDK